MGVVEKAVDRCRGQSFRHQLVKTRRVQVGRHGNGALLVGGVDEAVEALGRIRAHREQPDVVDLSRARHRSTYADPGTMPTPGRRTG